MTPLRSSFPAVVALALAAATGLRAQTSEPPVVLPKLTVSAEVPLVKVAEFSLPEERYQTAAVVSGDFIYIVGGSNAHGALLDSVVRFDTRTGKTENFAELKVGRRGHRVVLLENKIYVLGGYSTQSYETRRPGEDGPTDFGMIDSPMNPTGLNNPNVPQDLEMLDYMKRDIRFRAANPLNARVVERTGLEYSVEVIDLATRKVSHGVDLPEPRAQFACVAAGGKIYVIGGQRFYRHGNEIARTNTVIVFDRATGQWTDGVPMPTPRETEGALVDGGVIVVPGGYNGASPLDKVEVFNPKDGIWRILPPLCRVTSAHSLVFLSHYLFLFGDYASPDELVSYDLATKRSDVFTLKYRRARHTSAVVHDGKIYVIGGRDPNVTSALDYIQVFALRTPDAPPVTAHSSVTPDAMKKH